MIRIQESGTHMMPIDQLDHPILPKRYDYEIMRREQSIPLEKESHQTDPILTLAESSNLEGSRAGSEKPSNVAISNPADSSNLEIQESSRSEDEQSKKPSGFSSQSSSDETDVTSPVAPTHIGIGHDEQDEGYATEDEGKEYAHQTNEPQDIIERLKRQIRLKILKSILSAMSKPSTNRKGSDSAPKKDHENAD
ncbi:MAG: hypothetical protein MHMPM18_000129 [Marteilia pararefringens]